MGREQPVVNFKIAQRVLLFQPRFEDGVAHGQFVKQEFRCFHFRVGVEPALDAVVVKKIEDREKGHALVVRHPFTDEDGPLGRLGKVCRFIEAEGADPAH